MVYRKKWDCNAEKTCINCKKSFPITIDFWKSPKSTYCISCRLIITKQIRKKYAEDHKKEISNKQKTWRKKNKNRINRYKKQYNINNKDKIKTWRQKHYSSLENKEKKKRQDALYYSNNKGKIQKRQRLWVSRSPIQLMRFRISHQIRLALKKVGKSKNGQSIFGFLNYSPEDLKKHLESKFEYWMNWNNYGRYLLNKWNDDDSATWTWQIDHIIPQSKLPFDSMNHPNFKKCWSLENLRPLSAKENVLRKDNFHD